MAWRMCMKMGCPHKIRGGLIRFGMGSSNQPLADGRYCWRCRAKDQRRPQSAKWFPKSKGLVT